MNHDKLKTIANAVLVEKVGLIFDELDPYVLADHLSPEALSEEEIEAVADLIDTAVLQILTSWDGDEHVEIEEGVL